MQANEFDGLTNAEWKQLILKTIKAETAAEKLAFYQKRLVQRPEPGLAIEPFYTREDLAELSYLQGFHSLWTQTRKTTGWMNLESIAVYDEKTANQQALEVLAKGADAVFFNLLNRPGGKPMLDGTLTTEHNFDFSVLLHTLSLARVPVYFQMRQSQLIPLSHYLQATEQTETLMGGILFWEVSLWSELSDKEKDSFLHAFQNSIFSKGKTPYFKSFLLEPIGEMIDDDSDMETFALPATSLLRYQLQAAVKVIQYFQQAGLPVQHLLPQIGFVVDIGNAYFLEIAKLRALRLLWWQIGQHVDENSNLVDVFIYAQTTRMVAPESEPYQSMLANTTQAMAAIIGGCDALTVQPGVFATPEDATLAQRIARNVSVILKEESYFDKVTDMGAGSYLIENLTHQLAKAVWEQLEFEYP